MGDKINRGNRDEKTEEKVETQKKKKLDTEVRKINPWVRPGILDSDKIMSCLELLHYRRTIFLDAPIINPEASLIPRMLSYDTIENAPIKLFISSPGGDIDAGFKICDTMALIRSKIITIGMGFQSMAVPVFMMGDERYLFPHARVMIHLPWGNIQGDEKEIATASKQMTRMKERITDLMLERGATKSRRQILKDMEKDFWMEAEEAIKYGVAHDIIVPEDYKRIFFGDENA
jgi:ATP-dependent Clp protease protease subunit